MNEKNYSNTFRFALYQGNVIFCEKIFDADQFNPYTRYSVDIRDILPKAITKLQKVLSRKKYEVTIDCGRIDENDEKRKIYDFFHYNQDIINSFPAQWRNELRYNPESIVQQIEDKVIKGVECKIGFYINENPIVERLFYVDGFNPVARWSLDVVNAVVEIADAIRNKIITNDIKNMWDDYYLINVKGLNINQIRELSPIKREELLRRSRSN